MTPEQRARAIHSQLCAMLLAKGKPFTPWDQLPDERREQQIRTMERLDNVYAGAEDPPSFGLPADAKVNP